ncbi:MAG: hypothetical protein ACTSUG_01500 [Candidatus Helarchaeota archaeon]
MDKGLEFLIYNERISRFGERNNKRNGNRKKDVRKVGGTCVKSNRELRRKNSGKK